MAIQWEHLSLSSGEKSYSELSRRQLIILRRTFPVLKLENLDGETFSTAEKKGGREIGKKGRR